MISLTKKLLSVALAVVLLLGAFPATVSAATGDEWTVTFYDGDGSTVLGSVKAIEGNPLVIPEEVKNKVTVPADHELTGWIRKNGQPIEPVIDNFNIIPVFTKIEKCTVSFESNLVGVENPASVTVKKGEKITLPTLKSKGSTLVDWGTAGAPGAEYVVNADVTLTANWAVNKYTVRFLGADGSAFKVLTVRHGEKIAEADIPSLSEAGTRDGMKAYDWDGDPRAAITGDKDFKALYEANQYTITFDPNSDSLKESSKKVTYGDKIGDMPVYELQDHVPGGWFYNGTEYNKNSVYNFNHNITLTMKWIPEARVELHIYRNGKTSSAYTEPPVYGVAENSILYMSDIDIADYYKGSKSFKVEGIYDPIGWRAYKAGENPKPIEKIQTIPRDEGITELYVMVTDTNQPAETTKPTTKPADPSNPQTGDESMILATTAAMLISAGALAAIVYDRKRRMA